MPDWTPARPERSEPGWNPGARPVAQAVPGPRGDPAQASERPDPEVLRQATRRPRPRLRDRLRALHPAFRVLAAFVALALAIAVVFAVGAAATPRYGDLTPWASTRVADVRTAPRAAGWSADLARDVLPGVPARCATFQASSPSTPLVVITATSPPLGSASRCSAATMAQVTSTVALFDPVRGRVLWSRDLDREYGAGVGGVSLAQAFVVESVNRVVVQFSVDAEFVAVALSMTDGSITSSTRMGSSDSVSQMDVRGSLVLFGSAVASDDGAPVRWTLVDARHLDRRLWSSVRELGHAPVLLDGALFTSVNDQSVRIDGRTGAESILGDGAVPLDSGLGADDVYFAGQVVTSGVIITAWKASGAKLWARGGFGDLSGFSRECLFATLPGTTTVTCLDRKTGAMRWKKDLPSDGFPAGMTGQTSDDVAVMRSVGNGTHATILDGSSGRTLFDIELLPQTYLVAASRTTGYLERTTLSGTPTAFSAFDVRTGRFLWNRSVLDEGDTELWGGQLVSVDAKGMAHQLVGRDVGVLGAEQTLAGGYSSPRTP